jgi:hypothetical protein
MWELISHSEKMEAVSQKVVNISKAIGGTSVQRFTLVAR